MDRLLSVTTPTPSSKTVGYRYDRDGNRRKLIYPGGDAVMYAFDAGGRLTGLTDWVTPTPRQVSYAYYADGALQATTQANGTVAAYTYDNARRLLDAWNKATTTATDAITRHQLTLDAVGNRTQVVDTVAPVAAGPLQTAPTTLPTGHTLTPGTAPTTLPTGHTLTPSTAPTGLPNRPAPAATQTTHTYAYDKLYRLTSASGSTLGTTTYTYDPIGNRATRVRGGVTTTYSYDRADRIQNATSSLAGTAYTVDAAGNMTGRHPAANRAVHYEQHGADGPWP